MTHWASSSIVCLWCENTVDGFTDYSFTSLVYSFVRNWIMSVMFLMHVYVITNTRITDNMAGKCFCSQLIIVDVWVYEAFWIRAVHSLLDYSGFSRWPFLGSHTHTHTLAVDAGDDVGYFEAVQLWGIYLHPAFLDSDLLKEQSDILVSSPESHKERNISFISECPVQIHN